MSRADSPPRATDTDEAGLDDETRESLERLRDEYEGDVVGDICATVLQSLDNREVKS